MVISHTQAVKGIYTVVYITGVFGFCLAIHSQCTQVLQIDCVHSYKPEGNETVCGSDMAVYNNLCFFAKQKCRVPSLSVLYPGHCKLTTPAPVSGTTNGKVTSTTHVPVSGDSDFLHQVFCENKDKFSCPDNLDPVCGTDDVFYQNACELTKAQCNDTSLRSQDLTICKTSRRFKRKLSLV